MAFPRSRFLRFSQHWVLGQTRRTFISCPPSDDVCLRARGSSKQLPGSALTYTTGTANKDAYESDDGLGLGICFLDGVETYHFGAVEDCCYGEGR